MTNLFSKHFFWGHAAAAGAFAFLFAACGDEVTEVTEVTEVVGMQVVKEGDALPKCTADNEGAMVYSVDSAAAYTCIDKKWTSMRGKDGKDGADGKDGKDGADGKNGRNGKDGKDGTNGTNGTNGSSESSCTAVAIDNGYKIVCGGDSVGVVLNGKDGQDGAKGDSGATGNNGLSAYEIAKAGGYTGTEEEWIASLKGEQGAKGDSGVAGTSCSAEKVTGGVKITCTDGKSFTLSNGADGTSCSAEKVTGGVKITCTDGKSFTLSNGADGKDGKTFVDGWMVDPRDKQLYRVVTIGEQTWMAENLNYKTENSWCGGGSGENEGDCSKYGRLYTWATAVGKSEDDCGYGHTCGLSGKVRGVCPEGWHLPDETEWDGLYNAVCRKGPGGTMLKSQTGWNGNGNGTDAYGFSAFPAGFKYDSDVFSGLGVLAYFWIALEYSSDSAGSMVLYNLYQDAYVGSDEKNWAFSVRCVKD